MTEKELTAARNLFDELEDYFDDSALQEPVNVGDVLHKAITTL